ncbi:MAG: hypothetical protein AB1486_23525 [Planctomycetota bacterium]
MPELDAETGDAHLAELTREPAPPSRADPEALHWSAGSLAGRVVDAGVVIDEEEVPVWCTASPSVIAS